MKLSLLVVAVAVLGCSPVQSVCVAGMSVSCACVDGRMGAQTCLSDLTFGACQCGQAACNANNCGGCCDNLGTCQTGAANNACGAAGAACISCGLGQSCNIGTCSSAADAGQGCGSCAADEVCILNACAKRKLAFTTRDLFAGNLGGVAGADAKCANAARVALLPGTFKAWISDGSSNAIDRIADVGPWYNSDDQVVFSDKARLALGPSQQLTRDENGQSLNLPWKTWTGTLIGGLKAGAHCSDWSTTALTGQEGSAVSKTGTWTEAGISLCTEQKHLYCFQQ